MSQSAQVICAPRGARTGRGWAGRASDRSFMASLSLRGTGAMLLFRALIAHRGNGVRRQRLGMKTLWRHAHLVTLAGSGYGEIERGALRTEDDRIVWVGADSALPPDLPVDVEHDLKG